MNKMKTIKNFDVNQTIKSPITNKQILIEGKPTTFSELFIRVLLSPELIENEGKVRNYNTKLTIFTIISKLSNKPAEVQLMDEQIVIIKLCCGVLLSVELCAAVELFFAAPLTIPAERTKKDS